MYLPVAPARVLVWILPAGWHQPSSLQVHPRVKRACDRKGTSRVMPGFPVKCMFPELGALEIDNTDMTIYDCSAFF